MKELDARTKERILSGLVWGSTGTVAVASGLFYAYTQNISSQKIRGIRTGHEGRRTPVAGERLEYMPLTDDNPQTNNTASPPSGGGGGSRWKEWVARRKHEKFMRLHADEITREWQEVMRKDLGSTFGFTFHRNDTKWMRIIQSWKDNASSLPVDMFAELPNAPPFTIDAYREHMIRMASRVLSKKETELVIDKLYPNAAFLRSLSGASAKRELDESVNEFVRGLKAIYPPFERNEDEIKRIYFENNIFLRHLTTLELITPATVKGNRTMSSGDMRMKFDTLLLKYAELNAAHGARDYAHARSIAGEIWGVIDTMIVFPRYFLDSPIQNIWHLSLAYMNVARLKAMKTQMAMITLDNARFCYGVLLFLVEGYHPEDASNGDRRHMEAVATLGALEVNTAHELYKAMKRCKQNGGIGYEDFLHVSYLLFSGCSILYHLVLLLQADSGPGDDMGRLRLRKEMSLALEDVGGTTKAGVYDETFALYMLELVMYMQVRVSVAQMFPSLIAVAGKKLGYLITNGKRAALLCAIAAGSALESRSVDYLWGGNDSSRASGFPLIDVKEVNAIFARGLFARSMVSAAVVKNMPGAAFGHQVLDAYNAARDVWHEPGGRWADRAQRSSTSRRSVNVSNGERIYSLCNDDFALQGTLIIHDMLMSHITRASLLPTKLVGYVGTAEMELPSMRGVDSGAAGAKRAEVKESRIWDFYQKKDRRFAPAQHQTASYGYEYAGEKLRLHAQPGLALDPTTVIQNIRTALEDEALMKALYPRIHKRALEGDKYGYVKLQELLNNVEPSIRTFLEYMGRRIRLPADFVMGKVCVNSKDPSWGVNAMNYMTAIHSFDRKLASVLKQLLWGKGTRYENDEDIQHYMHTRNYLVNYHLYNHVGHTCTPGFLTEPFDESNVQAGGGRTMREFMLADVNTRTFSFSETTYLRRAMQRNGLEHESDEEIDGRIQQYERDHAWGRGSIAPSGNANGDREREAKPYTPDKGRRAQLDGPPTDRSERTHMNGTFEGRKKFAETPAEFLLKDENVVARRREVIEKNRNGANGFDDRDAAHSRDRQGEEGRSHSLTDDGVRDDEGMAVPPDSRGKVATSWYFDAVLAVTLMGRLAGRR